MNFREDMLRAAEAALVGISPEEMAAAPRLEGWYPMINWAGFLCLGGVIAGHPWLPEREEIVTSLLVTLDPERGVARCRSRWYALGEQDTRPDRPHAYFMPEISEVQAYLEAQLELLKRLRPAFSVPT